MARLGWKNTEKRTMITLLVVVDTLIDREYEECA